MALTIGAPAGRVKFRDAQGRWIRSPRGDVKIFDEIGPRLSLGPWVLQSSVAETFDVIADEVQRWMQENAPWEDQTGAAREGLRAETARELNTLVVEHEMTLMLYHTVEYGVYLELRWNGKYAIIQPAIEEWGPVLMRELKLEGHL